MTTTRFAPSPTGLLHVGNLRTALFNYLIARKAGGQFILRIDDTDAERSKPEYIDAIKQDLDWLGLSWDRVEHQSTRLERYDQAAQELRKAERFYDCYETPTELDLKRKKQLNIGKPPVYDRTALGLTPAQKEALQKERSPHWRFKLNHNRIEWTDGILGPLSIDAASVSDPVLIRADGQVLYTLASVCDDIDMGISHVVRGSDHVTNTATQIQIIEALGGCVPNFAHHSLLIGAQGEALSKRLGTLSLRDLREAGIEPMALLSYMARLGSSDPVTLFSDMNEMIAGFDMSRFGSAPTKFNAQDLEPLTAKYLHNLPFDVVRGQVIGIGVPKHMAEDFWLALRDNLNTLKDLEPWWHLLCNGATPLIEPEDQEFIQTARDLMPPLPHNKDTWAQWTAALKAQTGRKGRSLFMPLRKALTGQAHGPDMAHLLPLLKKISF